MAEADGPRRLVATVSQKAHDIRERESAERDDHEHAL